MKKLFLFIIGLLMVSCSEESIEKNDTHVTDHESAKLCTAIDPIPTDPTARVSFKGTYWDSGETIKIKFLNGNAFLQGKVKQFAEEWIYYAHLNFEWVASNQPADIKIAFKWMGDRGSWSTRGTECRKIAQGQPSMNFGWFDSNTSDTEFSRTVLHEFGHALGLGHEHQNPAFQVQWNATAVYNEFALQGWNKQMVDSNILNKYSVKDVDYTSFDKSSIMLYYFPSYLTLNNFVFPMNTVLSIGDESAVQTIYPYNLKQKILQRNEILDSNKSLISFNKRYKLTMLTDGNLVIYDLLDGGQKTIWSSKTAGNSGAKAIMQEDGNFVIYNKNNKQIWSTGTAGNPTSVLQLQEDGELIIYTNVLVWSSKSGKS
ncbi:matrixin family metalloprotease [Flavobacterium sp. 3-218]